MANRRRETEAEKAAREREERIELLKMKQGLIEESELIPENEHVEKLALHGWSRISNFFYHNKAFILLGAFFVFVISVLVYQIVTKEKDDLFIAAIAFEEDSELRWYIQDLETALERYCPDYDGNGKVHVLVNFIDRTRSEGRSQYDDAQAQKQTAEFMSASAQLYIADEKYLKWLGSDDYTDPDIYKKIFLDLSDMCPEDMLYEGVGIRVNKTALAKEMRWENCPDNVIILIRDELNNGSSSIKTNAKNRENALNVLRNILDDNIVNPET